MLERYSGVVKPMATLSPVCSAADVIAMQEMVTQIYCSPEVRSYVATIAAATRQDAALQLGASTRAAIALIHGAQACALLAGATTSCRRTCSTWRCKCLRTALCSAPKHA